MVIDPTFYLIYAEEAYKILGYLRSLGVNKIYDSGYGAEISLWAHVNYIRNHANRKGAKKYIAQTCPVLINYVEHYAPELIEHIIPIQSHVICTAIYAHKYLGDTSKMAFIGPCIARRDEFNSVKTGQNVNYNVTYGSLMNHIGDNLLDNYHAESDLKAIGLGNIATINGTFKEMVSIFFPKTEMILNYEGVIEATQNILYFHSRKDDLEFFNPVLVDFMNCHTGCVSGGGVHNRGHNSYNIIIEYQKKRREAFSKLSISSIIP